MAIISSVALGKVQKSVGNVTFQHYYGKTVAKQKIVRNPNYVPSAKQKEQRDRMYYAFKFANAWDGLADMLFVRSKWGTKRNNFLKLNYPAIAEYVKNNQSLVLPQPGFNVLNLHLLLFSFSMYNLPVYIAKGIDASISVVNTTSLYANGETTLSFSPSIVDAFYTKAAYRVLYFISPAELATTGASAPVQATDWKDFALTAGKWNAPETTLVIKHTNAQTVGIIYQIMIDDRPATVSIIGTPTTSNFPAAILSLPIV